MSHLGPECDSEFTTPRPPIKIAPPPPRPPLLTVFIVICALAQAIVLVLCFPQILGLLMYSPHPLTILSFFRVILMALLLFMLRALWEGRKGSLKGTTILVATQVATELLAAVLGSEAPVILVLLALFQAAFLFVLRSPEMRDFAR